jgi:hypothetical protein
MPLLASMLIWRTMLILRRLISGISDHSSSSSPSPSPSPPQSLTTFTPLRHLRIRIPQSTAHAFIGRGLLRLCSGHVREVQTYWCPKIILFDFDLRSCTTYVSNSSAMESLDHGDRWRGHVTHAPVSRCADLVETISSNGVY